MSSLILTQNGPIAHVRLNRPDVRNAFNDELITELGDAFKKLESDPSCRVAILLGEGNFFCAGADLHWMKSFVGASREVNESDARRLAQLLGALDTFPKPLIVQAHGAAIGGGVGLVAVADVAIASEDMIFALAEVKLGLIPAVISPFVINKMGVSLARRYFLTGERFKADVALRCGLVHEVVPADQLEARVLALAQELLSSGSEALKASKELIRKVKETSDVEDYTVKKIALLRVSPEGQEGIKAFLEKRKPHWNA